MKFGCFGKSHFLVELYIVTASSEGYCQFGQKLPLETRHDSGASLREIGRIIAAEVDRLFEAKVNPETIRKRAERVDGGTNVPHDTTSQKNEEKTGDNGDKKANQSPLHAEVSSLMALGKSQLEASEIVGKKYGKKPETVRKASAREHAKLTASGGGRAMEWAADAIREIDKIKDGDPGLEAALRHIEEHINYRRRKENAKNS